MQHREFRMMTKSTIAFPLYNHIKPNICCMKLGYMNSYIYIRSDIRRAPHELFPQKAEEHLFG